MSLRISTFSPSPIALKKILRNCRDELSSLLKIKFENSKNISVIGDLKKDQGPLGGVLSAMKWVKEKNKDYKWISTFPTDTPFFKREILQKFFKEIKIEESRLFFIKSNNSFFV